MIKKVLKIWLIVGLFFSIFINVFAFGAKLSLDKNESDINDYVKLRVKINSSNWWNIKITNVKWLDNFDVISQSQSQSSSTSIVVVNWKTESNTNMSINFDLVLKAKKKWKYTIWPATLENWQEKTTTNQVDVTITWDKLFVNGNHLTIPKSNVSNPSALQAPSLKSKGREEDINTYDDVMKNDFDTKNSLYLLLWVMLVLWLAVYFFMKNNKDLWQKKENDQEIDFDIKKPEIVYPEINNENFIADISVIFKQKLAHKYKISNIDNKTFDEIKEIIWNKIDDKILDLINMINKAKYSNFIWDNSKILELVKEI